MKLQTKRLFINNLPDNISQSDLEQKFSNYGTVASVEIKQRKNIRENQTAQFAYIQLDTQTTNLYDCINEFSSKKWKGQWLEVQEAKESFMDRLKREREQLQVSEPSTSVPILHSDADTVIKTNNTVTTYSKKYHSSSSESSSDDEQDSGFNSGGKQEKLNGTLKTDDINESHSDELNELVIKSNRGKKVQGALKIESVTPVKEPVLVVENDKKKKLGTKEVEADKKRLQSLMQMKKGYQQQKSHIKSALLNIDSKPKNKIVFDIDGESITPLKKARFEERGTLTLKHKENTKQDKLTLFDDEQNEGDDDDQYNFEIKEHLEGKKGRKLMQLQSRFKNDKRFEMDARFLEEGSGRDSENEEQVQGDEDVDISQENEKEKQFEILEEVLGKKVSRRSTNTDASESKRPKIMLRFDPSQPDHSKYELKEPEKPEKTKRKRKDSEKESGAKLIEEEPKPEVSKDTFYKVAVDLKNTLHEKEGFSLASMFSKEIPEEEIQDQEDIQEPKTATKRKVLSHEQNPFRYDSSSDEESDNEKATEKAAAVDTAKQSYANALERARPAKLWTESFFFKEDDYRLQEGFDFIKRLEGNETEDFSQLRRNLKVIVKAKVKNNQRKNRPFKRKLGGKKRIRVKRAMKR